MTTYSTFEAYYETLHGILRKYKFDSIDLDIDVFSEQRPNSIALEPVELLA